MKEKIIKIFSLLTMLIIAVITIGCKENEEGKHLYYIGLIDPASSIMFDYENPNRSHVSLGVMYSNEYSFESKKTSKIVSDFNEIPINLVPKEDMLSENSIELAKAIKLTVFYKYVISKTDSDDAAVEFYVLEDGRLLF